MSKLVITASIYPEISMKGLFFVFSEAEIKGFHQWQLQKDEAFPVLFNSAERQNKMCFSCSHYGVLTNFPH